jgi:hypothetical protein
MYVGQQYKWNSYTHQLYSYAKGTNYIKTGKQGSMHQYHKLFP